MNRVFGLSMRRAPALFRTSMAVAKPAMTFTPKRFYWPNDKLMHRVEGDYHLDPKEVAPIIVKMVALHDNCADPSKVTLSSTFEELGLNDFDKAEILLMTELHWNMEISDDDCETMITVNDTVEYISRCYFAS